MTTFRILIVDDQRDVRQVLRAGIESLRQDIEVIDVPSGEEAMLVISRQPIDLLVADVRLPGISGLELKEKAQKRNPDLALILITGLTDPAVRKEVEAADAYAFFYKPVSIPEFLKVIQDCFTSTELRSEVVSQGIDTQDDRPPLTLVSVLTELQTSLGASAVAILTPRGEVEAQVGELPKAILEQESLFAIMAFVQAVVRLSSALATGHAGVGTFSIADGQVLCTAIDGGAGLLVVNPGAGEVKFSLKDVMLPVQKASANLHDLLRDLGVSGIVETTLSAETIDESEENFKEIEEIPLPELDEIFTKEARKRVKREDVDAFWEAVEGSEPGEVGRADTLSYDQAHRLGLTPEE